MNKMKEFTVGLYGRSRLLDIVVVEGMRMYPKSTWYDYSNAMQRAIAQEHQLAASGRMRPEDVAYVRRAVVNQKSPQATDIILNFSLSGNVDQVKIVAGKKTRTFVCNGNTATQRDPFFNIANQVVYAIPRPDGLVLQLTSLDDRFAILMLSIREGNRALPLALHVEAGVANMGFAEQQRLLARVLAWLPPAASVMLSADRFYLSVGLIGWLQQQRWYYRVRLKTHFIM